MKRIAITGGIASGKSYVCRIIERLDYPIFYCDDAAKKIIRTDHDVMEALKKIVGDDLYTPELRLEKQKLASFICGSLENAKRINAVVHPHVRDAYREWVGRQRSELVFMECPLFYEANFEEEADKVICVFTPEPLRLKRFMERENITQERAEQWIKLQMPEEEKCKRADFVITNDGIKNLKMQIDSVLNSL